jgi:hypothetical protein
VDVTGTCHLSQLGLTTTAGVEAVTAVAGGFLSSGVYTYRAANGDILNTTGTGLATLNSDFSGITFSSKRGCGIVRHSSRAREGSSNVWARFSEPCGEEWRAP